MHKWHAYGQAAHGSKKQNETNNSFACVLTWAGICVGRHISAFQSVGLWHVAAIESCCFQKLKSISKIWFFNIALASFSIAKLLRLLSCDCHFFEIQACSFENLPANRDFECTMKITEFHEQERFFSIVDGLGMPGSIARARTTESQPLYNAPRWLLHASVTLEAGQANLLRLEEARLNRFAPKTALMELSKTSLLAGPRATQPQTAAGATGASQGQRPMHLSRGGLRPRRLAYFVNHRSSTASEGTPPNPSACVALTSQRGAACCAARILRNDEFKTQRALSAG